MSHTALRRVAIRLLHDATLVQRLADDPAGALAGADLSAEERAWLLAVPPAAWRTDPERPGRVLAALREEYVAATALAPARADAFFRCRHFHEAVQERGSLATAFGRHMAEDADARTAAVARLELAMAAVRRAPRRIRPSAPGRLRLTPRAALARLPHGTSDLLAALHAGRAPTPLGPADERLLVVRAADGLEVSLERLDDDVAALLERALPGASRTELVRLATSLGADPEAASAVVDGFVADGLLV